MSTRVTTPDILGDMLSPEHNERSEIAQSLRYDYSQLGSQAAEVRDHAIEIKRHEKRANENIIEAGRHLIAVKESLGHGQWEDWLQTEFHMTDRTARTLMAIATKFVAKTEIISDLNATVLGMLAAPSVPEVAVNAVIDASAEGKVSVAQAKQIIAEHKPTTINTANIGANRPAAPDEPASDYAEIWQLEGAVRKAINRQWLAAPSKGTKWLILEQVERTRINKAGALWNEIKQDMPDTVKAYRHSDLQQAIANVAEQLKQGMQRETELQWGTGARFNGSARQATVQHTTAQHAATATPSAAAAPAAEHIKIDHTNMLSRAAQEAGYTAWATYQDGKKYGAGVVAPGGGRSMGGPFSGWQQLTDWADSDMRMVQAATASAAVAPTVVDVVVEPAPAAIHEGDEAQLRLMQLEEVQDELTDALETLNRFGDLTGKHTETLLAARELRKLLDILNAELDALKKEL